MYNSILMRNVLWIQKYRQHIFAVELLVAIIFGPALGNILGAGVLGSLGLILGIIVLLEAALAIFRLSLAKAALVKTEKTKKKFEAAHTQVKKDYTQLTGERLDKHRTTGQAKKKKRKKNKKTHRR